MNTLSKIALGKEVSSTRYPYAISLVEYEEGKLATIVRTDQGVFVQSPDGSFLNDVEIDKHSEQAYLDAMEAIGLGFQHIDGTLVFETENKDYRMVVSKDRTNLLYEIDGRSMDINLQDGTIVMNGFETSKTYRIGEDITQHEYLSTLFRWSDDLTPAKA